MLKFSLLLLVLLVIIAIYYRNCPLLKNNRGYRYIISVIALIVISFFGINIIDILPISEGNLKSLETVANFFQKNDLRHIKLENDQYVFFDKSEKNIRTNETDFFITDLSKNHISFVYGDVNRNIYFDITNSNKIYVFNSEGFNVKIGELMWVGKVKKIINKNWIILDECTRTNCPELDK